MVGDTRARIVTCRAVERVGRQLDVAGRDVGASRLDGGQDDAAGDDRQQQGRDERQRVAERDRDERPDRTLGRDDRRNDRDLADRERLVRHVKPGRVAQAGEQDERQDPGFDLARDAGREPKRQADDRADDHHPREHDPGAQHPARPGGGQGRGRPQDGGGEATKDRGHTAKCGGSGVPASGSEALRTELSPGAAAG